MSTAATTYLVTELTKSCGTILEALEALADDVKSIDAEVLSEQSEDLLPKLHEALTSLASRLQEARMITLIASMMSKPKGESGEES